MVSIKKIDIAFDCPSFLVDDGILAFRKLLIYQNFPVERFERDRRLLGFSHASSNVSISCMFTFSLQALLLSYQFCSCTVSVPSCYRHQSLAISFIILNGPNEA